MDPAIVGLVGVGVLIVTLMIGVPIGISLVLVGMGGLSFLVGIGSLVGEGLGGLWDAMWSDPPHLGSH